MTLTPPDRDTEGHKTGAGYEPHLGADPQLESESVFTSLISSVRDVFFPVKLPPLELQSKPIAVQDRMAVKRDPVSTGVAVGLHAVILLLIFFWVGHKILTPAPKKQQVAAVDLAAPVPPTPQLSQKAMGGGGGNHDIAPVTKGRLPKFSQQPLVPVTQPPKIPPKLAVDPTLMMQKDLKMANNNMPNLGDPRAAAVGVASLGNGSGGGIGSGRGNGLGPGESGNTGGGVYQVGNGVSEPQIIYQTQPEFSEEARKAKFQGSPIINLVVDATGHPQRVRILRGVGMGLDEKAIESVKQWRFRPAKKDGQPVAVELNVEVNFSIF